MVHMKRREVRATYRIQLTPDFGFSEVADLADYLARLGVTHVYCSPYLQAAPGSEHGYDVTIHSRLNEELGGAAGFEKMCAALEERGLGHIADVVPNHVAAVPQDPAWWDLLKRGRSSTYATWFDVAWDDCDGKILVGILGDDLDAVLERNEITRDGDVLRYFDHVLPIAPGTEGIEEISDLLEAQNYQLTSWKYAVRNLNYRRFFDVSELIGLNIDDIDILEHTHRLIFELLESGAVDGLRIDHIDGLRDPLTYLERIRERIGDAYLVVEKILEHGEELPQTWPVEGTTGYEALNLISRLFIDRRAEDLLTDFYVRFTGVDDDPRELMRSRKMLVMRFVLPADLSRHARALEEIFIQRGWEEDRDILRLALAETIAGLHVYRTYISPEGKIPEIDRSRIEHALADAKERSFLSPTTFDRIGAVLLLEEDGPDALDFVLALQQFTGPVMAKAIEDTFFYNYNRFVALNEVGGDPLVFGAGTDELTSWTTKGLVATSTHDTKRSEDVRARLSCLTSIPEDWEAFVLELSRRAESFKTAGAPDRNTEYALYQNLIGAWPIDVERACAYMSKAIREAKRFTSWLDPDPAYEEAVEGFTRSLFGDREIVAMIDSFASRLVVPGRVVSLAQTLVKLTLPGVPDIYQGCELWDHSLVDPDNRRPVDFDARRAVLEQVEQASAESIWSDHDSGAPKLLVTTAALKLRARFPEAFEGPVDLLPIQGPASDRVLAYSCGGRAIVIVPRTGMPVDRSTTEVRLPDAPAYDELARRPVEGGWRNVDELLGFPVALLTLR